MTATRIMDPEIPFAHKRIWGQLQKGDGVWSLEHGRFVKVKKVLTPVTVMKMRYPIVTEAATVAIRKCVVEQPDLPGVSEPTPNDIMQAHQFLYYVKCAPIISDEAYDMFCKQHGLQGGGGSDPAQDYSEAVKRLAGVMAFSPAEIEKWKAAQTEIPGAEEGLNLDE